MPEFKHKNNLTINKINTIMSNLKAECNCKQFATIHVGKMYTQGSEIM